MSRVSELKNARDNLSVKFIEFTRIMSKKRHAIFFEGEDEKYYSVRINNIRPDITWSGINTGGKSNVIEMRRRIRTHNTYANAPCMFFVDADFDDNSDLLTLGDIYVTPCYSVENLYISSHAYVRILSAEFGINDTMESSDCFKQSITTFEKIKFDYINAITPFNLLIRELRIKEKCGELNGRLNINNVKFEDLVKVELDGVEKIYNEQDPKSIFPELQENISVELERSKEHFSTLAGDIWFRGKQNLEFFRVFLEKIKTERCKKTPRLIFKEKGNVKLQVTKGNCISELSHYADTPPCLIEYLRIQQTA
ncbi:DUF4435 domain-containing protein [Aeromonas sp. R7-3]|uniref:DUF4435 domain-containing protein n=1 Tax=Aeromonas sp. R7-3 TaxID=3138475 RepID=UPI0034A144BD